MGQDDFAPQALAYFLHLIILGICLRWFRAGTSTPGSVLGRWLWLRPVASLARRMGRHLLLDDAPVAAARGWRRAGLMVLLVLVFAVIVSSHQLTPGMSILAVSGLAIFQRVRSRSLPLLMIVLEMTWIVFIAFTFLERNVGMVVDSIAQVTGNTNSNLIDLAQASSGQAIVALIGRGLTAFVWGLALLGGIRRLRNGYLDFSCIILAVSPFLMLGGNLYGGEILFRIYFFSLPLMAFFGAAFLYPSTARGTSRWTILLAVCLSVALAAGLSFAYWGKERMNYFTQDELEASQFLYDVAPAGSLLIGGSFDHPSVFEELRAV